MTDRRVKVVVDADYQPLIDGSGKAAVSVKVVKEEISELDKQVEETGRDMEKLAAETALAKKEVDGLGSKARGSKRDLEALDEKIKASRRSVQELGLEFARTGEKVDSTAFNRERSVLARLERLRKELTAPGDSKGNGRGILADALGSPEVVATSFGAELSKALKGVDVKGALIPGLIAGVAVIAPALGAMIAGAVTGVVGIGGVAGGLFAASKDPGVRNAAADLGHHISESFFGSGSSFVDPIKQSVGILEKDFDSLDLGKTFAIAAPYVTEFTHGIGGLADEFMPGFNKALEDGKPAIDLFAQRLPEIGQELGDMFAKLADSQGTIEGVNSLFNTLDSLIEFTGTGIAWLGNRFHDFDTVMRNTTGWLSNITNAIGDAGDTAGLRQVRDAFTDLTTEATQGAIHFKTLGGQVAYADAVLGKYSRTTAQVEEQQKALNDAIMQGEKDIDDYVNRAIAASNANIAVAQDFADLNENLLRGKKNWDVNTQAGRDNLSMINNAIGDLERQRQQAIETSDGSVAAIDRINAKYNDQMRALEALAVKAGDTKAAFEAMAGVYQITIIETLRQRTVTNKQAALDKAAKFAGFATGGTTPANEVFKVGEHGTEYLFSDKQQFVATKQQMAQPWARGGMTATASSPQVVISFAATGDAFLDGLVKQLSKYVRVNGGSAQFN